MEAAAAFGLAANAMQMLEYAAKLIKTANKLRSHADSLPVEMHEIEATATSLVQSVDIVAQKSKEEQDQGLAALCDSSLSLARELLNLMGAAKEITSTSGGNRNIIRGTFRAIRIEKEASRIQSRLLPLQQQLGLHLTIENR
jgi:hypothetical protein